MFLRSVKLFKIASDSNSVYHFKINSLSTNLKILLKKKKISKHDFNFRPMEFVEEEDLRQTMVMQFTTVEKEWTLMSLFHITNSFLYLT